MTDTKQLGNMGEKIARSYLLKSSYIYVAKNYKSGKFEIDLIFKKSNKYIFIEIKTRIKTSESMQENPLAHQQAKRLQYAMINYCLANQINLDRARLDLIIILIDRENNQASLTHHLNII